VVLGFLQPLPSIGQEAIGVGPGLVQEVLHCLLRLFPSQSRVGGPTVEGILWRAAEMISMASWCALARISLADALAHARTSSALSVALAQISSASFLACSWRSATRQSRRQHLSVAWWRRPSHRQGALDQ
jgi:hypothetical protein